MDIDMLNGMSEVVWYITRGTYMYHYMVVICVCRHTLYCLLVKPAYALVMNTLNSCVTRLPLCVLHFHEIVRVSIIPLLFNMCVYVCVWYPCFVAL